MNNTIRSEDEPRLKEFYSKVHLLLDSSEPLTIPNYNSITFSKAQEIITALDAKDIRKAQLLVMAHVFDLRNRTTRLTYFYRNCSKCADLMRIFEAANLAVFQENYIAAYFTATPLVEGLLLRWMGHNPKNPKPSFPQIKRFATSKITSIQASIPAWKASDNLKIVASYQMDHTRKLLNGHVFEKHLSRISELNRHLALHMLDVPRFCNSLNLSQLIVLIDNMIDAILWDEGNYGKAWSEQFNDSDRGTRRMYEMAFQAANLSPTGAFRFATDINDQNKDFFASWVLDYRYRI